MMRLHEKVCTSEKVDQMSFQSCKCENVTLCLEDLKKLFIIVARDKIGISRKCLLSACVLLRTSLEMN